MSITPDISQYIHDPSYKPFLIGIGGVSMCSLAETLFLNGCAVAGSDFKESETVAMLRNKGIPVTVGHRAENIEGADYIIRSAAIHEDNPEIIAARQRGIPVFERAEGWGAVMQQYDNAICIAGTHGKTSTTSMMTHIALAANTDPTVMIGGALPVLGGGHRVGQRQDVIVLESCEYCNSFLQFYPTVAVILNVEADHLDFFKDLDDVKNSFRQFALRVPEETGVVVMNADDPGAVDCLRDLPRKTVTFGLENPADYQGKNIRYHQGTATFDVYKQGELFVQVKLLVPGKHNVLNALAAIAAADVTGMDVAAVGDGLASYTGVGRRFEYKGEYGGAVIYDDYAHHPGEIKALLDGVEEMGFSRIIAVFQPHTYTRTAAFMDEFAKELARPDLLVLADIFAAREVNTLGISSGDLAAKIDGSYYIPDFGDIVDFLKKMVRPGDCVLTIGAGELNRVAEALANQQYVARRSDPFVQGVEDGGLREVGQINILICYLLKTVGGYLPRHLLDNALQMDGLCSFWGVAEALSQLLEKGLVEELTQNGVVGYRLTGQGALCADELETAIPLTVRERAVNRATALLAKAKALVENRITVEKEGDNYVISCMIPDGERELMTVRLGVGDKLQADMIRENFLEDPAKVYQKVLEAFGIN